MSTMGLDTVPVTSVMLNKQRHIDLVKAEMMLSVC